jgi:hypothetical protein
MSFVASADGAPPRESAGHMVENIRRGLFCRSKGL